MKEHNYALQNAVIITRPRLQIRMRNICFVISIAAVILELMVKITSIFGSYRFLRIAWHFLTFISPSSKLEFVYSPCCRRSKSKCLSSRQVIAWTSQSLLN